MLGSSNNELFLGYLLNLESAYHHVAYDLVASALDSLLSLPLSYFVFI